MLVVRESMGDDEERVLSQLTPSQRTIARDPKVRAAWERMLDACPDYSMDDSDGQLYILFVRVVEELRGG